MPEVGPGPTVAETEAWATRERRRREQWALGPTPEQAALGAMRERERRALEDEQEKMSRRSPHAPTPRIWRTLRTLQLAGLGALRLMVDTSASDAVGHLVQAGLDWERINDPRFTGSKPTRSQRPGRVVG